MKNQPLVSVVMATYNRAYIINKAINSVKQQTYKNWELVIVDDRSTDDTKKLIESYAKKDNRIKYIVNNHNKGCGGARNCGILHAKGKYVAFLDSDDEWTKNHLSESVEVLKKKTVDICFSYWYEQSNGRSIPRYTGVVEKLARLTNPIIDGSSLYFINKNICENMILNWSFFYHINTAVVRKKLIKTVGLMYEDLYGAEDIEFLFRLLLRSDRFGIVRNFHYIWHEGKDNCVHSHERSIDKFNSLKLLRIKVLKLMRKNIKDSDKIINKKRCCNIINRQIALVFYDIGWRNKDVNRKRALYYYVLSNIYAFDLTTAKAILLLFKKFLS